MTKIHANWLLVPCFLVISACSQHRSINGNDLAITSDNTVMLHWLEMDEEGIVRETKSDGPITSIGSPYTGQAIETFEKSPTKSISSWLEGKKHGSVTEFYYNGRKRLIIEYREGKRHGLSKEFRITGELWREENYDNDVLDGMKLEYHPNGMKIFEVNMVNGLPHGEAKEWYPDTTPKSSTLFRHGLREGPASEWYPNGKQRLGLFYQRDKQHGARTIWYENGQKRLSAQFVEGMMQGNSQGWFPSGQIQFDYNFKDNLEHGVCTEWDENGVKISEILFENGLAKKKMGGSTKPQSVTIEAKDPTSLKTQLRKNTDKNPTVSSSVKPTAEKKKKRAPVQKQSEPSRSNEKANAVQTIKKSKLTSKPKKSDPKLLADTPNAPVEALTETNASNSSETASFDAIPPALSEATPPPFSESPKPLDPFGDFPLTDDTPLETPQSTDIKVPSDGGNPFETPPSPSPSVDPFDPPPAEDPFAVPPPPEAPASFDPFSDIPPPPPAVPSTAPQDNSLDPFGTTASPDSDSSEAPNVPLGDIFGSPPDSTNSEDNLPQNIPEPPPPPPTFDPFAE